MKAILHNAKRMIAAVPAAMTVLLLASPVHAASEVTSGFYELVSASDDRFCIDLRSCTLQDEDVKNDNGLGTLQTYERLDVNSQKFYFEEQEDGTYAITSMATGENLTAGEAEVIVEEEESEDDQSNQDSAKDPQAEKETAAAKTYTRADVLFEEISLETEPESADDQGEDRGESESKGEKAGTANAHSDSEDGESETLTLRDVIGQQKWHFRREHDGGWYICDENGLYLTCDTTKAMYGSTLSLQEFTGWKNQRWYLQKTRLSTENCADTDHYNPYDEDGLLSRMRMWLHIGSEVIYMDSAVIGSWIMETENHGYQADKDRILAYVQKLADEYDTQGVPRKFVTHGGSEITLFKGNYGWKTDVEETARVLREAVEKGEIASLEVVWSHEGASYEKGNDIGSSYVEISLKDQVLWLYIDGKEVLETDVVTGTYGTDRQTPGGVYSLTYKQSPAVLRGEGYESPVTYWMPFNGGIGMHDASWRSEYGGDIYLTNGSHGCINMPLEAAKTVYETVEKGFPVVLYN